MQETVLSVDLGGTKILVGEVTRTGEILASKKYPSNVENQRIATAEIKKVIKDYLKQQPIYGKLIGIAVCVVGRVDTDTGTWLEIHPGLADAIPLADEITQLFLLPCWIANDVTSAALAEKVFGIGKETKDFIYINIGTGIAGRIIHDGHMIGGSHFNAGEIGHMVVDINSDVACTCGRKGCVELFVSGLGMHNQTRKFAAAYPDTLLDITKDQRTSFQELVSAYERQDGLARRVIDQALQAAAALTMNLIRVSDPEAIVFGGGIMNDGWFLSHLVTLLNAKTIRFVTKGFQVTSLDPNTIALKGAAVLVLIGKGEL